MSSLMVSLTNYFINKKEKEYYETSWELIFPVLNKDVQSVGSSQSQFIWTT